MEFITRCDGDNKLRWSFKWFGQKPGKLTYQIDINHDSSVEPSRTK